MYVIPPTILKVDGITIRVMSEKLRVVTWKMSNKSFSKVSSNKVITEGFLKIQRLSLLIKRGLPIQQSANFTG